MTTTSTTTSWIQKFEPQLEVLREQDFFEIPDFMSIQEINELRSQILELKAQAKFRAATLGAGKQLNSEVRSDQIFWIDETLKASLPALEIYFSQLEELRLFLNERFFLGLRELESHFSIYSAGTFYQRHLDNSKSINRRKLSLVCYLNSAWEPSHGGELRIYGEGQNIDVAPIAGKLVGFLSSTIEHEVLLSRQERLSLTSWFS